MHARTLGGVALTTAIAAGLLVGTVGPTSAAAHRLGNSTQQVEEGPAASCPTADRLTVENTPAGTNVLACDLVGVVVYDGRVGVEIPAPGTGMVAHVDNITGSETSLDVSVTPDGAIRYDGEGGEPVGVVPGAGEEVELIQNDPPSPTDVGGITQALADPCKDRKYNLLKFKAYATLTWNFNSNTVPSELTAASSLNHIRAAVGNITGLDNSCGLADDVSATSSYDGATSAGAQISAAGICAASDAKSVVSFGDLPNDYLAVACSSYYTDRKPFRLYTSDIKINKQDFTWTDRGGALGCSGLYDLQAVMTHEWGHSFGMGHVSESQHGKLTMSTQLSPCDTSHRSLELGDVLGLRARY